MKRIKPKSIAEHKTRINTQQGRRLAKQPMHG